MAEPAGRRPPFPPATLAAAACVVAGALLAVTVDMAFVFLFAVGVFGPGALREIGWLRDQDEFQRQAAREAGYRAWLAGGLAAAGALALLARGRASIEAGEAVLASILLLTVTVWLLALMFRYWGARRAAARVLLTFGTFWFGFVALSHGSEPVAFLGESLVVLPFFVLAWTAGRWPRVSGTVLVALSAGAFVLFRLHEAFGKRPGQAIVLVLFLLPLLASGIGLLRERRE